MFLILMGLILIFFVTLFIITSIIHKKQFAYDTHQDYNYPSLPSTAHTTLKAGTLTLPATISGQDTVIAKIRIKSTWAGLLILPFVETISSKGKWKQYFEFGIYSSVLVASPLLLMFGLSRENIAKEVKKKEEVVV